MKYFSLFSGVGGFELSINNVYERLLDIPKGGGQRDEPLQLQEDSLHTTSQSNERQGATCVGFSEIDKYAISVYQYHYKNHKNHGDITQINWNTVPDFDLVVGGSPCQDLSVAGKQKGLSGARSGLFFEFVRCLKEKQPTNFIWENVKGALSSSSGWDFARVQIEFSEAGYDCEWQVLNAKDFGVPQNRERIFVVGYLRGKSRPKVFPIRTINEMVVGERDTQTANTLTSNYWKGPAASRPIVQVNQPTHSNGRQPKILSELIKGVLDDETPTALDLENNAIHKDRFMCLQDPHHNKHRLISNARIRRLTPSECMALMSWPRDWCDKGLVDGKEVEISDTQKYKMAGNGVVSKVVEAIIERLFK